VKKTQFCGVKLINVIPMKLKCLLSIPMFLVVVFSFFQCASENDSSEKDDSYLFMVKDGVSAADTFQIKTYDISNFVIPDFVPANTFPYYENEKWGFANKGGEIVIPCQYDNCGFFTNGVAWVMKGNKYGLINKRGKLIIDYIYDGIGKYEQGVLPVKRDYLWGFIDTTGKQILPFLYEDFDLSDNQTIHVKQNRQWGLVDRNGKSIIQPIYNDNFSFDKGLAIVSRRDKKGVINKNGKELIDCKFDFVEKVNDSIFIVGIYKSYDKHIYGVMSISGKDKIPVIYKSLQNVVGQAVVAQSGDDFGLLSLNNDTLINFEYSGLKSGNTNLLAAKQGGLWGFIDFHNNTIIPFKYRDAEPFINKLAIVAKSASYGVINNKDEEIIPFQFYKITRAEQNIFKVGDNSLYGFYNSDGKKLTEIEYDYLDYHSYEDYTGYREEEMDFGKFVNGFAIVGKIGRVGMINSKGEVVVPLKYHHLLPFDRNGITVANFKDRKLLINSKGNELTETKFEKISFDESSGYYYAEKEMSYSDKERNRRKSFKVGYFDFNGYYYGKSQYDNIHYPPEQEIIEAIRVDYQEIMKGEKTRKYEHVLLDNGVKGSYSEQRFVVNDENAKTRYEYYYNHDLNRYGPFFIFIVDNSGGSKKENRFYYQHGKIVRWVGPDGKQLPISDAMYCPEEEHHMNARRHLIMFNNAKVLKNTTVNSRVKQIDALCQKINEDISLGRYKKGDTDNHYMGEYSSTHDTYLDKNGDKIYESSSESDEGGSNRNEKFFQNGKLIRDFHENSYYQLTEFDRNAGWFPEPYDITVYYFNGEPIRSYRTNAGIEEVEEL